MAACTTHADTPSGQAAVLQEDVASRCAYKVHCKKMHGQRHTVGLKSRMVCLAVLRLCEHWRPTAALHSML